MHEEGIGIPASKIESMVFFILMADNNDHHEDDLTIAFTILKRARERKKSSHLITYIHFNPNTLRRASKSNIIIVMMSLQVIKWA